MGLFDAFKKKKADTLSSDEDYEKTYRLTRKYGLLDIKKLTL